MASKADLHIHTTASDGADTPRVLAEKIAAAGLELFSVTDHDTIAGALEMEKLVPRGVRYIRGVEFSCVSPAGKCHILGYGYDPDHPAFRGALEEGRRLRLEKLDRRLEQLKRDHGIELTDAVRDALLLNMPMRVLCREDCRGICPRCGINLNKGPCTCQEGAEVINPFSALKNIVLNDEEV